MDLQSLQLRIARSENLPVLPTVVVQILRLYEDPNISARSLEKIIEQDPAMTAKIIRVAGSSMYGLKSVTSVNRALSVLGMNTLRSIAISLAYQQILSQKKVGVSFDHLAFWRHCLAVGIGSRALMRHVNLNQAEEAYVTGLMHDIGVLTMDRFANAELMNAVRFAQQKRIPLHEAEVMINKFTHCDIGGFLADKWKLTKMMTNAIKYHEDPSQDSETPESTSVIAAANYLAYKCGFPAMPGMPGGQNGEQYLLNLGLEQAQIEEAETKILVEVDQADEAMGSQRAA